MEMVSDFTCFASGTSSLSRMGEYCHLRTAEVMSSDENLVSLKPKLRVIFTSLIIRKIRGIIYHDVK